jgi:hypothetical protein
LDEQLRVMQEASKLRMQEAEHAAKLRREEEKLRCEEETLRAERELLNKALLMELEMGVGLKKRKREFEMDEVERGVMEARALKLELTKKSKEEKMKRKLEDEEKAKQDEKDNKEYVEHSKKLQATYMARFKGMPKLEVEPLKPGYLEAYLTNHYIKYTEEDVERFKHANLDCIVNWMSPHYMLEERTADEKLVDKFFIPINTPVENRKEKVVEGYMALLRILGDPYVAANK